MPNKTIELEDLAQSVTSAVLRAVAAQTESKAFLTKNGGGLIVNPMVTIGGMLFFGEAGRFVGSQTIAATRIGG